MTPISTYIQLAKDKQIGPAYFHLNQNAAIKEDDQNNWLVSKDAGGLSRQLLAARGILGDQYFPEYIRSIMVNGQDQAFKDLFSQEAMSAIAPMYDKRGEPLNRTVVDAIQHAKKANVPQADYYGTILSWLDQVGNNKMPDAAKDNMVRWAYTKPGVTDELKMDYRDPQTGQIVPGKYRAFNLMLSDKIIQSVAQTAKAKPENYTTMKNWGEAEFGSLFRSSVQDLNKIVSGPIRLQGNQLPTSIHFSYDDTTKQFGLVDGKNRPIDQTYLDRVGDPSSRGMLRTAIDNMSFLNSGIKRMQAVYQANPQGEENIDKHLLTTLQTLKMNLGNATGIPGEMGRALIKTQRPELTNEQIDKLLLQ
jgi:hypothetical protein